MAMNISLPNQLFATDPVLIVELLKWVQCCNQPDPVSQIQALHGPFVPDPLVRFIPGSDARTNVITVNNPAELLVCIGGATTRAQIINLLLGIQNGPAADDVTVAVSTFYNAAKSLQNDLFGSGHWIGKRVYIVGHSFGGGVAQVLGALIQITGQAASVKIWSFGAPRAGTSAFAHRLSFLNNYRFHNAGDVVPWLAPHSDEIPTTMLTEAITLWRNCNTLCQAPSGYSLQPFGRIDPDMGNPPRDWTVLLGLARYMTSVMVGGAGPQHSVSDYLARAQQSVQNYPQPAPRPSQPEQAALTLRPRERDALIAVGEAEIFADATSPTGHTRTYVVPSVTDPAAPRYKARRDGDVWVVMLGEEIVASATGKRHARHIARVWNRSARALLNVTPAAGL